MNAVKDNTKVEWKFVLSSILFAKAAVATFAIAPFLLGGYIDYIGLSVKAASMVLSVEIFALAIVNASAFFWIHKIRCRSVAQKLLVAIIFLNLLCTVVGSLELLILLRMLIGACEGALLAVGFGLLSNSLKPDKNFGLYFGISLTVAAINIRLLPLFLETVGVVGLFVNLSLYAVIALLGSVWSSPISIQESQIQKAEALSDISSLKDSVKVDNAKISKINFPLVSLFFLLLANYIYFIGQGGVWSFLERIGQQQSIELVDIATALSLSLFAGVAGGLTASWLDLRFGRVVPLVLAIGFAMGSLLILLMFEGVMFFTIAVCLFNYGNNLGHPYVLGFTAEIDKTARLTVLSGALHTGGQATGPLIAGLIIVGNDFSNTLYMGLLMFAFAVFMFLPVMLQSRKINKSRVQINTSVEP